MSVEGSIAAVVLAAGASRRLGRAKQMVMVGGETLLERSVRVAVEAGLEPVIVVVRAGAVADGLRGCEVVIRDPEVASVLGGFEILVNELADEGMAASIRCGVSRALALGAVGAVVMSCDQVALRAEHLRALCAEVDRVTGSGYAGKVGIPAYFPAASFDALMELRGDVGARALLRGAVAVVDEGLALDVDTEADLLRAQESYADGES